IATGHPTLKRTVGLAKGMATQTWEDITHPYERPGYLLLDALAAASTGIGTASRIGLVGRAIARGDLGEFGVLGTAQRVRAAARAGRRFTLPYGDQREHVLLSRNPTVRAAQRRRLGRIQKQINEGGGRLQVPERGPFKGVRYKVATEVSPEAKI